MEIQSVFEPATPGLSYINASYWKNEDSGYHTSFTPGSIESSQLLNEKIDSAIIQGQIRIAEIPSDYGSTPASNFNLARKFYRTPISLRSRNENIPRSPINRRGVKRPYQYDDEVSYSSTSTPTTKIAGGIQRLKVTDNNTPSQRSLTVSSVHSDYSTASDIFHPKEYIPNLSYPTTPIKKICQTSCKLSPSKRSAKKNNFTIHSLSCETRGVINQRPKPKVARTIQFMPYQKLDIVGMLYDHEGAIPPVTKILSYLSNEDIQTFRLVSPLWRHIWNDLGTLKKKQYKNYLKEKKDNRENIAVQARRSSDGNQIRSITEVHNILNAHMVSSTPRSPPGTPRTNKFKKFTKVNKYFNVHKYIIYYTDSSTKSFLSSILMQGLLVDVANVTHDSLTEVKMLTGWLQGETP